MQYKLVTALAAVLGATQVAAMSHGDSEVVDGSPIRWQQLAQGVFTGVPEEEWDDKVNKMGNQEWDAEEMRASNEVSARSEELSLRNIPDFCQAVPICVKTGTNHIAVGINIWNELAAGAANGAGKDLFDFLTAPFYVANIAGVAFSGKISGQIDINTKIECSTDDSQMDAIGSALNMVSASTPDASDVAVQVNGPSGSWTIYARAGTPGSQFTPSC